MATAQEVLNQITDGMSVQELRDLMNTVDADPNADTVALYSGGVGDIDPNTGRNKYSSEEIAKALSEASGEVDPVAGTDTRTTKTIFDTEVAKLIESDAFQSALEDAISDNTDPRYDGLDIDNILSGRDTNGNRTGDGFWDDASRNLVNAHDGSFEIIGANAPHDSVMYQTEIPALMDKGDTSGVKVNGIPLSDWQDKYNNEFNNHYDEAIANGRTPQEATDIARAQASEDMGDIARSKSTVDLGELDYGRDADGKLVMSGSDGSYYKQQNPDLPSELPDGITPDRGSSLVGALDIADATKLARYTDLLNKAGIVGDLLGTGLAIWQAQDAYDRGDYQEAGEILAGHLGALLGGLAGGATAAGLMTSLLLIPGVNVGVLAGMGLVGAAGLAGGYLGGTEGEELFRNLYEDLVEQGLVPALNDLADDYGWAWDNPGAIGGEIFDALPPWMQDTLEPILNVPGVIFGHRYASPLVIDIDRSGTIDLTNVDGSNIRFDFWQDGFSEITGWVAPQDGLLVRDVDGNGVIEGVAELFGSNYPLGYATDQGIVDEENGFVKLALLDSNQDGVIDANDDSFSELQVWQDLNQDGVSQADELFSLASVNIDSIDVTNYVQAPSTSGLHVSWNRVIEGNYITHSGSVTFSDGDTSEIVDAWFANNLQNSVYTNDFNLDVRTLFLPTLRGYGNIADLHIAMSLDESLLDSVAHFTTSYDLASFFSNSEVVRVDVEQILLSWAGYDDSRTIAQDRMFSLFAEYDFIDKFMGLDTPYLGTWFDGSAYFPFASAAIPAIFETWDKIVDSYTARLAFQSGGSALFENTSYNYATDVFEGDLNLSQSAISLLENEATGSSDLELFWLSVAKFIDSVKGIDQLTTQEISALSDAVDSSSANTLTWSDITALMTDNIIEGTSDDETIIGTRFDDVINGNEGNDILDGGEGDDILDTSQNVSYSYNNTLIGGSGNDVMSGGRGDDTYVYDSGDDVIIEKGGNFTGDTDIVIMGDGIAVDDVSFHIALNGVLTSNIFFDISGRGTLTLQQLDSTVVSEHIDEIHFEDSTVIKIKEMDATYHGTNEDDYLNPNFLFTGGTMTVNGYGGNDRITAGYGTKYIIDGGDGNDTIRSGDEDDVYIFSAGVDSIEDSGGYDIIKVPEGFFVEDMEFIRANVTSWGGYNDAVLILNGLGTVHLYDYFTLYSDNSDSTVEIVEFSNGQIVDLSQQSFEVRGTDGDDIISENVGGGASPKHPVLDSVYIWGQGNDIISEVYGGVDTIRFGEGITFESLSITAHNNTSIYGTGLLIEDQGGNSMFFKQHFNYSNTTTQESKYSIERLEFFDGSVAYIHDYEYEVHGSDDMETIRGLKTGDASADDTIYGYGGNDTIEAYEGDDLVFGGDGNDRIFGYDGEDELYGEEGNDTIYGMDGDDIVNGGNGDDILHGDGQSFAYTGNDILIGGAGADTLYGNSGNDTADYSDSNAGVNVSLVPNAIGSGGHAEGDTLISIENLIGSDSSDSAHRDYLYGNSFDNHLQGMAGNDILEGGAGADIIDGGAGWDYARYTRSASGVTINLLTDIHSGGDAEGDTFIGIEAIVGSSHDDTIIGGNSNDHLRGENGNDTLSGGIGSDQLYGGNGDDTYIYTAGNDRITEQGSGIDRVVFDASWNINNVIINGNILAFESNVNQITFNDIGLIEAFAFDGQADMTLAELQAYLAGSSSSYLGTSSDDNFVATDTVETFDGLGGSDTIDYSNGGAVNIDLQNGNISGGYAEGDALISIENIIGSNLSSERDWIWGDANDNHIQGMAGNDILEGGDGADIIDGGTGWDYSRYLRSDEGININLETNVNTGGHAEGDTLIGIEAIIGSNHNDTIIGGSSNDYLKGELGDDVLSGGGGIDQLYGGAGADTFLYEAGTAFTHVDQIRDFNEGEGDMIDIADLLFGYDPLVDAITDFVQITDNGMDSTLAVDADGGADNFTTIATLYGVTGMTDEEALETSGTLVTL